MSGPVLQFDAADTGGVRDRDREHRKALHAAWTAATLAPTRDAIQELFSAAHAYATFWERVAMKAERLLNAALASDSFSDEERARILETKKIKARDAKLLLETEVEILEMYRACSPKGRGAIREMLRWAVACNPKDENRRRRPLREEPIDGDEDDVFGRIAHLRNIGKPVITIDTDERPAG